MRFINRLFRRIDWHLNRPKKGDTYEGYAEDFGMDKYVWKSLHRLVDTDGISYSQMCYGIGSYRIQISSDQFNYFVIFGEALIRCSINGWERNECSILRRVKVSKMKDLFLAGRLVKL